MKQTILSMLTIFVIAMLTKFSPAFAAHVILSKPVALQADSWSLLKKASDKDGDQWKVLVFGFTHCSDICPASMGSMSMLVQTAKKNDINLDGAFITVDPERDSDETLAKYTEQFGPHISYLRLEGERLDKFKDEFGVEAIFYTKNKGNQLNYQVDHSTTAFLVDPSGKIRMLFDVLTDVSLVQGLIRKKSEMFEL